MVKVRNIPITQSMIAQLKYNVITFNGRLSIPGAAYFLFIVIPTFFPKTWKLRRKIVSLLKITLKVKQYGCSYK